MRSLYIFLFMLSSLTTFAQVTINSVSVKIDSNGVDSVFLNYTSNLGQPYHIQGYNTQAICNYTNLQWYRFKDSLRSSSITIDTSYAIYFGNFEYGYFELQFVWDTLIRSTPPPVPWILMDSFIFDPCSTTSVNEISVVTQNLIQLYPNPAFNQVNIEIEGDLSVEDITIYDINGKIISNFQKINTQIDLFGYTSGLYYIRFNTNKGIISKKIIVTD